MAILLAACALAGAAEDAQAARKSKAKASVTAAVAPVTDAVKRPDFAGEKPSHDALQVATWVLNANDNEGSSFVIVDKHMAKAYVFTPKGRLRSAAPVLLGMSKGDETFPGVGDRELSDIAPHERTTPAGRFVAELGVNGHGVDIVWVDYEAAVSMHRVITTNPAERRLQRLASPRPDEHRISYGCINVPTAFYEQVLAPTVRESETIIYVLPDTLSPAEVFGFKDAGKHKAPQTVPKAASAFYLDGA